MKKVIWILFLVLVLLMTGCATGGGTVSTGESKEPQSESTGSTAASDEVDDVSGATPKGEGWMISLTGVRNDEIWQSHFESWKGSEEGVFVEMNLEKKGETNLYGGILLKDVIAIIDDPAGGMPYVFQDDLWMEGYDITLTAADGYAATFSTSDVSAEEILLVDTINGEKVSPQIVGNITGKAWVRDLASIELSLAPVDLAENSFEFILDINGETSSYTISELEAMDIYIEDTGSFTNSYGNTTDAVYGGVKLLPLLSKSMEVTTESAIKVVAMDGYEMSYGGDMLLDQADGEWILAFKENGEYMPEDPGYIRLVKVGPRNPNITGHVSARMIKKIVTEGEPFQDFILTIVEEGTSEIFDRQTMQSGVITNKNRVTYYDRKDDADIAYMGIALWRLLERLEGYSAIQVEATDGFSVTLDNTQVEGNDEIIIAMYTGSDDSLLSEKEWPLRLVWDKDASTLPDGIKAVRNVVRITLVY
ncbi:MAG: molybdopterin-dependent oxidoreductase [Spirochaetales bacterium]|nr:molybdopterin-dependent oxidoreductase [Spirochaetales bacterium]